ncbi:methyl-accepting chemotaxis protein [Paenibacillus sp. GCM10023252]|uniref:methyl-accepting chemotaxis protein n=1 Tax=Paenibacillus sp. GCM10023252 TaxID=3252649 RepID=UPI00361C1076
MNTHSSSTEASPSISPFEQLASKILYTTFLGLLISSPPLYWLIYLTGLIDMIYAVGCTAASILMIAVLLLSYRSTASRPSGKYWLIGIGNSIGFTLIWLIPSPSAWAVCMIYVAISVIYFNNRVSLFTMGASLASLTIHVIWNETMTNQSAFDIVVMYTVLLIVNTAAIAVCLVGSHIMRHMQGQNSRIELLLTEVQSSSQVLSAFGSSVKQEADSSERISRELAVSVAEVSIGTRSQASSTSILNASLSDMQGFIGQISESTDQLDSNSHRTTEITREGLNRISSLVTDIEQVNQAVQDTVTSMSELTAFSEQIGSVTSTISAIVRQTGILALNAGIEAARAGEHGRGFGVIAQEIRKLSSGAEDSMEQITATLTRIHEHSALVSGKIAAGGTALTQINESAQETSVRFKDILHHADHVSEMSSAMRVMLSELVSRTSSSAEDIEAITAVTEETSAAMEEITTSLEEQSASMQQMSARVGDLESLLVRLSELVEGRTVQTDNK